MKERKDTYTRQPSTRFDSKVQSLAGSGIPKMPSEFSKMKAKENPEVLGQDQRTLGTKIIT